MSPAIVRQIYKEKQLPAACKMNGHCQCAMVGQFSAATEIRGIVLNRFLFSFFLLAASLVILHSRWPLFTSARLIEANGCAKVGKIFGHRAIRPPMSALFCSSATGKMLPMTGQFN
jgi:hypothetical protein